MSREDAAHIVVRASMKALPKRKGNDDQPIEPPPAEFA